MIVVKNSRVLNCLVDKLPLHASNFWILLNSYKIMFLVSFFWEENKTMPNKEIVNNNDVKSNRFLFWIFYWKHLRVNEKLAMPTYLIISKDFVLLNKIFIAGDALTLCRQQLFASTRPLRRQVDDRKPNIKKYLKFLLTDHLISKYDSYTHSQRVTYNGLHIIANIWTSNNFIIHLTKNLVCRKSFHYERLLKNHKLGHKIPSEGFIKSSLKIPQWNVQVLRKNLTFYKVWRDPLSICLVLPKESESTNHFHLSRSCCYAI